MRSTNFTAVGLIGGNQWVIDLGIASTCKQTQFALRTNYSQKPNGQPSLPDMFTQLQL